MTQLKSFENDLGNKNEKFVVLYLVKKVSECLKIKINCHDVLLL